MGCPYDIPLTDYVVSCWNQTSSGMIVNDQKLIQGLCLLQLIADIVFLLD